MACAASATAINHYGLTNCVPLKELGPHPTANNGKPCPQDFFQWGWPVRASEGGPLRLGLGALARYDTRSLAVLLTCAWGRYVAPNETRYLWIFNDSRFSKSNQPKVAIYDWRRSVKKVAFAKASAAALSKVAKPNAGECIGGASTKYPLTDPRIARGHFITENPKIWRWWHQFIRNSGRLNYRCHFTGRHSSCGFGFEWIQ